MFNLLVKLWKDKKMSFFINILSKIIFLRDLKYFLLLACFFTDKGITPISDQAMLKPGTSGNVETLQGKSIFNIKFFPP